MRSAFASLPILALILLAGCGDDASRPSFGERGHIPSGNAAAEAERPLPRPPEFTHPEPMSGTWENRFEYSQLNGCWFSMTPEAVSNLSRLFPAESADAPRRGRRFRVEFVGRRSIDAPGQPNRYGHMGGWPCEIRADRLIEAQVLGPA